MSWETAVTLNADVTYVLGGTDEKTGKPNPKSVEGYFLGNRITPDKGYGPGTLHIFQTKEGNVGIWGKTSSKGLLTDVMVGRMCLLTFTGMSVPAKKGRQPAYQYKLQFDRANTIDVSGIDVNAADESEPDYGDVDLETPTDADETESYVSEPTPVRAAAPKAPARTPNLDVQAKIRAQLAAAKASKSA